jgi:polyisoprenoid-binding protein YceI
VVARYRIVPGRSRVWIHARSSLHPIHSETDGLEGWVELSVRRDGRVDLDAPSRGHLELQVDQLRSGNALEEAEMRRRVNTRRYPTIEGDLATMRAAGDGRYLVEGDLTFRGVTRRYRDEMTVEVADGDTLNLAGESTFDVRDHGMEPPRLLLLRVEPEVKVRVAIVAEKEG